GSIQCVPRNWASPFDLSSNHGSEQVGLLSDQLADQATLSSRNVTHYGSSRVMFFAEQGGAAYPLGPVNRAQFLKEAVKPARRCESIQAANPARYGRQFVQCRGSP